MLWDALVFFNFEWLTLSLLIVCPKQYIKLLTIESMRRERKDLRVLCLYSIWVLAAVKICSVESDYTFRVHWCYRDPKMGAWDYLYISMVIILAVWAHSRHVCVCLSMHVCVSWVMCVRAKQWVQLHVDAGCCEYSMFVFARMDSVESKSIRQQMYFYFHWFKWIRNINWNHSLCK